MKCPLCNNDIPHLKLPSHFWKCHEEVARFLTVHCVVCQAALGWPARDLGRLKPNMPLATHFAYEDGFAQHLLKLSLEDNP